MLYPIYLDYVIIILNEYKYRGNQWTHHIFTRCFCLETEVYKTPGLVENSEPVLVLSLVLFKRNPVYPPGDVLVNIRGEGEMEETGPILYRDSTKAQSVSIVFIFTNCRNFFSDFLYFEICGHLNHIVECPN